MPKRWSLTRAGITNVYQYDDEILHFAGGRLLLRGVNGSGKSTAMNMLLPFLLEADTRRIDAAGEQAGVLRSWMLSDRAETQPVGYLWVEFTKGEDHLVCGCGIRANRNTDRVTTWWFLTDRRPGVDFSLVENRVPLSVDALRATVGEQAVFSSDQRGSYRAAVRARLFGGADLDQHLRLLHVIRSPRVGDRIDLDLSHYLEDALPALSEAAIDDAAQPLEDLEEHRRNVENLIQTSQTLTALADIYRQYARTELRGRTAEAATKAAAASRQAATVTEARAQVTIADEAFAEADAEVGRLESEMDRIDQEMEALRASTAYQEGQELDTQKRLVDELATAASRSAEVVDRATGRLQRAAGAVTTAQATVDTDHRTVTAGLADLASLTAGTGLAEKPPAAPALTTVRHGDLESPAGELGWEQGASAVENLRGGVRRRREDVEQVEAAVEEVDGAEQRLREAERDRARAEEEVASAQEQHTAARHALSEATAQLQEELKAWWDRMDERSASHGMDSARPADLSTADLTERRQHHYQQAVTAADALADHHRAALARLAALLEDGKEEAQRLAETLEELDRRHFPDPPALPWQRPTRRLRLAEMIDFAPHVAEEQRRGVEAAMEAAGLLGAEVVPDGSVVLENGDLLAAAAGNAATPLSELVVVALPDEADIHPQQVEAVLASISTDSSSVAPTIIAPDGRFRIGTLVGRHAKEVVEHIGAGARKAALERRQADAAALLRQAQEAAARTERLITARRNQLDEVTALRSAVPDPIGVTEGLAEATRAGSRLDDSRTRLASATDAEKSAEAAHASLVSACQRLATQLRLPAHRPGLAETRHLLDELTLAIAESLSSLRQLGRSHASWRSATEEWRTAQADMEAAQERHRAQTDAHHQAGSRLAALEDSIGLEYDEVLSALEQCRSDRDTARQRRDGVRLARDEANRNGAAFRAEAEAAEGERIRLEEEAVLELDRLRRALAVPGLTEAAGPPDQPMAPLPAVEQSAVGLAELAQAVASRLAAPVGEGVNADGVRQSLRRRRDSLGAGWDAEDRQPDDDLPVAVEINGPLGRMSLAVAAREVDGLRERQASLLTAKQDQALRNLLQGLIAREVTDKLAASRELVDLMNDRLATVATSHGVGVRLRWRRRDDLDPHLDTTIDLLAKPSDLRTPEEDDALTEALAARIDDARRSDPEMTYRDLVREVLDYRHWHEMSVYVTRAGQPERKLGRRTPLSEGEKKIISYLALFSAVAASCDALAVSEPASPRFVLLDDAFAKVSEDNHAQLFGLLVEMDLDFVATSERLWGTHATVPELAITEVVRDAELATIVLEHARWNGRRLEES